MLLMIDNYDSFTYNLVHYFAELGQEVKVVRNDAMSVAEVGALKPDYIVLSPGPCTPNEAGICLPVLEQLAAKVPVFGVCLGHQSIGQAFGGKVVRAKTIMHGKTSMIHHKGEGAFKGLPIAVRSHTLPQPGGGAGQPAGVPGHHRLDRRTKTAAWMKSWGFVIKPCRSRAYNSTRNRF